MNNSHIEKLIIKTLISISFNLALIIGLLLYSVGQETKIANDSIKITARLTTLNDNIKAIKTVADGYFTFISGAADGIKTYNKIKKDIELVHIKAKELALILPKNKVAMITNLEKLFNEMSVIGEKMVIASISEEQETFGIERDKYLKINNTLDSVTNTFLKNMITNVFNNNNTLKESATLQQRLAYILIVISIFALLFSARLLIKGVRKVLIDQAEKLSKEKVKLENGLEKIVTRLNTNYQKLQHSVVDLDDSSSTLSTSSTHQAAATEEAVAAMEEISSMVSQTNENGNHALTIANNAQVKVQEGQNVVKKLSTAMEEIHKSNNELSVIVNLINEITEKTKIINSIVVKTELLSFNASIEAARAAEYGKGFAVVAEEVGNLARLSGKSSTDIEKLLGESVLKVNEIVELIQSRVTLGQKISEECVVVFNDINNFNNDLASSVNSISTATNEQTKGVEQTTLAMNDISKATQENLKVTQSTAHLSNTISTEIEMIHDSMKDLQIILNESKKKTIAVDTPKSKKQKNIATDTNTNNTKSEKPGSQEVNEDDFNPEELSARYNKNINSPSLDSEFNDGQFK